MTTVVPFDDTDLSRAALKRASQHVDRGESLLSVSVIPNSNASYARERGWLDAGKGFDPESIVSTLSESVADIAPEATFDYIVVGRYANAGEIASKIRRYAKSADARLVVIGSENAGRIVTTLGGVGGTVATDTAYDVLIVRSTGT